MNKTLSEAITAILSIILPYIAELVKSKVVPTIKRKAYEKVNEKTDKLISDLAQNAEKIKSEKNQVKKTAYIEGTKLGIETIRALSEKLSKAADEIEKVL